MLPNPNKGNGKRQTSGTISASIGSTYSFQHLVGGDTRGDGTTRCTFIFDPGVPPPGADDDIVTFDGVPEPIRTDILGTVPTVTESMIDTGDGTRLLKIESFSPTGTELFPGGLTDLNTGTALTDGCLFLGLSDPLDNPDFGAVTESTITFLSDSVVVEGPIVLTGAPRFSDPWNGRMLATFPALAGRGINRVRLEIRVQQTTLGPVNACCVDTSCRGDIEQESCLFQHGSWQVGATCGADSQKPGPVCDQVDCGFDNGPPLDDGGGPLSRFAPDFLQASAAADDFILRGADGRCRITQIRAWTTHPNAPSPVDPNVDYQGVAVTVYRESAGGMPRGQPLGDGTHVPDLPGGIVYNRTLPMNVITATPVASDCVTGQWRLDIPVDMVLARNERYWLEIQPIMPDALGDVAWLLSENQNGRPALAIGPLPGLSLWQTIPGNTDTCPGARVPTPSAQTRSNLAFQLFGVADTVLRNDDCSRALPVFNGVTPFSNEGALTDGVADPLCDVFLDGNVASDVWFQYAATCTGTVTFSLCGSQYDTKLAVYAGCGRCLPSDPPIACNDESCGSQSQVSVEALEGDCFLARIGGFNGAQGQGIITVTCEAPPEPTGACCRDGQCLGTRTQTDCAAAAGEWFVGTSCGTFTCPVNPPPNDECVDCIPLVTGVPFSGTTRGSSGTDISSCGANDNHDVWHCWTADCTGNASINLCDTTAFDTTLSVFESCNPPDLFCNDDACGLQAAINPLSQLDRLAVFEGQTYHIRVSGFGNTEGNYTILVNSCISGCCLPGGRCVVRTPDACTMEGGRVIQPGAFCRGADFLPMDGVDDACPRCPPATILQASPPSRTVDARQTHPPGDASTRQGIGSAEDSILLTLDPPVSADPQCFTLCETTPDALLGPNSIATVTDQGDGTFVIRLDRPITPGAVTTIQYFGDVDMGAVSYFSHPGNVDGTGTAGLADISVLMNCCLNQSCVTPWGSYSCDVDHSGEIGPGDLLRVIDLLNGSDGYDAWLGTLLPDSTGCP